MTLVSILTRATRLFAVSLAGAAAIASASGAMPESGGAHAPRGSAPASVAPRSTRSARVPETRPRPATSSARHASTRPVTSAGMVVGIDRESGQLGAPTAAQAMRLGASRRDAAAALAGRPDPVYHANGSISLDARGWMRDYSIVRIGRDGRAVVGCFESRDAAARALRETPPAPATLEER